jgi:hypothetical protein
VDLSAQNLEGQYETSFQMLFSTGEILEMKSG